MKKKKNHNQPAPGLDGRAEEAHLICLLTDGSQITHSGPPASPCWNGVAAHGGVGEAAQAEEEMIVIEYEMSIARNELAIQVVGRCLRSTRSSAPRRRGFSARFLWCCGDEKFVWCRAVQQMTNDPDAFIYNNLTHAPVGLQTRILATQLVHALVRLGKR